MSAGADRIREDFDAIARAGGGDSVPNDRLIDRVLAGLPERLNAVLDAGCGTGALCRRLAPRAARVVGIDLSPEMIRVARERGPVAHVEYRVADLMAVEFPPASFDAIVSVATLHHLPLAPALARLAAWLTPGGALRVLDLMSPATPADYLRFVGTWLARRRPGAPRERLSPEARRAWDAHGRGERYATLAQVRAAASALPGATVVPMPEYRYLLSWRRPDPRSQNA